MAVARKWETNRKTFLTAADRAANPVWKNTQKEIRQNKIVRQRAALEQNEPELELEPQERVTLMPFKKFLVVSFISLVSIFCFAAFIYLAINHNRLGREVSRLTNEKVRLTEINRELKADMARLTVFEDLDVVARESLGLVTPSKGQIVIIE
ncbi:MAG: hypothetical protein LBT62_03160 [Deltaproteobacteria bacterium]|jgi:hypothetical protein|nr:hypothetical protein [Deltaproteobacteria bacterium]